MPAKHYTLKPVATPLPSERSDADAKTQRENAGRAPGPTTAGCTADPAIRAENEDDDGYDPYSDRREERPLFESDPWN